MNKTGNPKFYFKKGKDNIMFGKRHSKETKLKMSLAHIGQPHTKYWLGKKQSDETRKKISVGLKGRPTSLEHRRKLSLALKGRKFTEEWKRKIGLASKGRPVSKTTREKIGNLSRGSKSHFWRGGISTLPYSYDWTNYLKISIRERDNYTCQMCGEKQGDYALNVHHIDYDKMNCNTDNLISLCNRCHMQTNHHREYWIKFFKKNDK